MKIKPNYDLTALNTFRLCAEAQYFVMVKNKDEFLEAIAWAKKNKLPISLIAGGSNILFTGKKIKGLVIKLFGEDYSIKGNTLMAWAGTGLTRLAKVAAANGLSGLEWAYGIPGSLGGAVRGNAGAYGSDIARLLAVVEAYDSAKGKMIVLSKTACGLGYRHSIFKEKKDLFIINVKLKLIKQKAREIKKLADAYYKHRFTTKPKEPSAGCVFKNLEFRELLRRNKELALELEAKGLVRNGKIGVGYLIDQLGFKGFVKGGAKISHKHANFIINTGQATPEDVIKLIKLVKKNIKSKYKIKLEEEIQYLGS